MRSPKDYFRPLAVGAPQPLTEIPFRPSRSIHFFDPSNEKMVSKVPSMAESADVLLGNLEDAIQVENKEAARRGLVQVSRDNPSLGGPDAEVQLWTRVNALDSPWVLDDITTLVTEIGPNLDVIMIPKVEGAEDIHYLDRLSRSSRHAPASTGRSCSTRSSRPRAVWPTSRTSHWQVRGCRASRSDPRTSPRAAA